MWEVRVSYSYLMISQPTDGGRVVKQQRGTSKRHQMDEKTPILGCTLLHQYLNF